MRGGVPSARSSSLTRDRPERGVRQARHHEDYAMKKLPRFVDISRRWHPMCGDGGDGGDGSSSSSSSSSGCTASVAATTTASVGVASCTVSTDLATGETGESCGVSTPGLVSATLTTDGETVSLGGQVSDPSGTIGAGGSINEDGDVTISASVDTPGPGGAGFSGSLTCSTSPYDDSNEISGPHYP